MGAAEMKPHVEQHVKINPGGLLHCTWFPRTRQNGKVRNRKGGCHFGQRTTCI